ncbi:hypothetical protein K8089_10890 [Aequorivita sp. F47161]|uniref:Uncharacterized protein n=1 Tax=Aequorivita vitellina TaxID=2874475 RepID=A0A9X1QVJ0_9FLAO|nr:hypothetical protein [Aequorivita vitellina]MCG2419530.1 hypothetical protein [Aequorivita vitellina]
MKKKKLLKKLNALHQSNLHFLQPKESRMGKYYEIAIPMDSHLELMFLICNLLKVCILAMGEPELINDRQIPQPEHNVKEVLRHILHLIPLEELQFVDEVSELLKSIKQE